MHIDIIVLYDIIQAYETRHLLLLFVNQPAIKKRRQRNQEEGGEEGAGQGRVEVPGPGQAAPLAALVQHRVEVQHLFSNNFAHMKVRKYQSQFFSKYLIVLVKKHRMVLSRQILFFHFLLF